MSILLMFLIILTLKAEAKPPDNDLPGHQILTYGFIYNTTYYNAPVNSHRNSDKYSYNNSRVNEVDDRPRYKDASGPLLVGFAKDPLEYSVPEDDYVKGVRNGDPQMYKSKARSRGKRHAMNLCNMMSCVTGCDPVSYDGYGCYCGMKGKGIPTDGIDRCCQAHDKCYGSIKGSSLDLYIQPYSWKCNNGAPLCNKPWYQFLLGPAGRLCECDRIFALCLSKYGCPKKLSVCPTSPERQKQGALMILLRNELSGSFCYGAALKKASSR